MKKIDRRRPLPDQSTTAWLKTVPPRLAAELLAAFADLPDPRKPRGIRHSLANILVCCTLAKLCGAVSFAGMVRWMENQRLWLNRLGLTVFSIDTLYRISRVIDADRLDDAMGKMTARLADRAGLPRPAAVAIDGKTLNGSVSRWHRPTHLVAAIDQRTGLVLAQRQVKDKGGEQGVVAELLAAIAADQQVIVTADAGFDARPALAAISRAGYRFAVPVKGNQPGALAIVAEQIPWDQVALAAHIGPDRTHGRTMEAWVKGVDFYDALPAPIPDAKSVIQIRRRTERPNQTARHPTGKTNKDFKGKKTVNRSSDRTTTTGGHYRIAEETVYIITSASPTEISYQRLYWLIRNHWRIENQLHHVRDVTMREDASRIRTGNSPRFMATLNNIAISAIRIAHGLNANIQAAKEHCAANIHHALTLFLPLIE